MPWQPFVHLSSDWISLMFQQWYILLFLLSGCMSLSGSLPIAQSPPLLDKVQLWQMKAVDTNTNSLLLVQPLSDGRWRWLQSDVFGSPIARKIWDKQGWHNDGFLPPNAQATHLFSAISTIILVQKKQLHHVYPHLIRQSNGVCFNDFYQNKKMWKICQNKHYWQIELADGSHWQLKRLEKQ